MPLLFLQVRISYRYRHKDNNDKVYGIVGKRPMQEEKHKGCETDNAETVWSWEAALWVRHTILYTILPVWVFYKGMLKTFWQTYNEMFKLKVGTACIAFLS